MKRKDWKKYKAQRRLSRLKQPKTFNMSHRIVKTRAYNDRNTTKQMTKLYNADIMKKPFIDY